MGTRRSDAEARANVAAWCPDFQPAVPYPGALTPWDGSCRACGRLVRPTYANMSQGRGACRPCGWKRGAAAQMLTDAAARENALAWAPGFLPAVPYPGALAPWDGTCTTCGSTVAPTYHSLQQGYGPCLRCGREASGAARRLSDAHARENAATWVPDFQPSAPYPGSNQTPWQGLCLSCGRNVSPTYGALQQGGSACAFCAGRRVDPESAAGRYRDAGGEPTGPYPGRNDIPWPGSCGRCGGAIAPTYGNLQRGKGACNACAKKASGRSRHLDPASAAALITDLGFEPLEPYPGSAIAVWRVRHSDCGAEMAKSYNNLQQGHGCPDCVEYSYSRARPGWFYVVASAEWLKAGVTNIPKRRFAEHRMQGLDEVLHLAGFPDGAAALELEALWLEHRQSNVPRPQWATIHDIPNGYTEAVRRTAETEEFLAGLLRPGASPAPNLARPQARPQPL